MKAQEIDVRPLICLEIPSELDVRSGGSYRDGRTTLYSWKDLVPLKLMQGQAHHRCRMAGELALKDAVDLRSIIATL